jgi:arylsulfatase
MATERIRAQVGKFTLAGDGLCVGYDSGDNVSALYKSPGEFHGGNIDFVTISTESKQYIDLAKDAKLKMRD